MAIKSRKTWNYCEIYTKKTIMEHEFPFEMFLPLKRGESFIVPFFRGFSSGANRKSINHLYPNRNFRNF